MRTIYLPSSSSPEITHSVPRFLTFFSYSICPDNSIKRGRLPEALADEAQSIRNILDTEVTTNPENVSACRIKNDRIIATMLDRFHEGLKESRTLRYDYLPPDDPTIFAYALAATRKGPLGAPGSLLNPRLESRRHEIVDIVDIAIAIITYEVRFKPSLFGSYLLTMLPAMLFSLICISQFATPVIIFSLITIAAVVLYGLCEWLYVNHFDLLDVIAENIRQTTTLTADDAVNGFVVSPFGRPSLTSEAQENLQSDVAAITP